MKICGFTDIHSPLWILYKDQNFYPSEVKGKPPVPRRAIKTYRGVQIWLHLTSALNGDEM